MTTNLIRRIIYPLLLVAFGCWLLGPLQPVLLETAELTPFFTTSDYLSDMLHRPAGGVYYVASLLQSTLARPQLGTGLLLALLLAVGLTTRAALRVRGRYEALCWLAPLALLTNYTQMGYMLYTTKMPAPAFTPVVGVLGALLTAWLLRSLAGRLLALRHVAWRTAAVVLTAVVLMAAYWLLGAYALLAGLLFAALLMPRLREARLWTAVLILTALVTLAAVPHICWQQGWCHVLQADLYRQGLPEWMWTEATRSLAVPLWTAFMVLTAVAVVRLRWPSGKWGGWLVEALGALLFVGALWQTHQRTFRDTNFLSILQMKQALEAGDADRVLQLSMQTTEEPTRAQVMLTRIALWQTRQAGDRLFTYPDGSAPYNAPTDNQHFLLTVGRTVYYYLGKTNFAYRWCMEHMEEYGRRPTYLMYMAKCAMLNGETALARKYLGALGHTLFYRDFAERYETLVAQHRLDSQQRALQPLLRYADILDGDGGLVEVFCLQSCAHSDGGSREMVDMSLMCNLITKNAQGFWPRFFQLYPTWKGHIPVHYQEAALLFAQLQGKLEMLDRLPFDATIRESFKRLVQASAQNGDSQTNAVNLRPEFGGTYWYYYFFIDGLKAS